MSQQLINRSPDLKRLRDEGYEIEIVGGYIVIHRIPYLTQEKLIEHGKIIVPLNISGNIAKYNGCHVVNFMGQYPCNVDGSPIEGIRHATQNNRVSDNLILNYSFSNKPPEGYKDHYDQISRYADIISAPAIRIHPTEKVKTFRVIENSEDAGVFQYMDTNESRANIANLNNKFRKQKIAIIGLGGTGAYILDFVSKTPVSEIHLFDGDIFSQHNAFRTPGAVSKAEIECENSKVEHFHRIYSNIHRGIFPHCVYVTAENANLLADMSYIFVCIDNDYARSVLIKEFILMNKTFFDVGLGVNVVDNDSLIGSIRLTTGTPSMYEHTLIKIPMSENAEAENEYATNIQIADLNALNAILAVVKWKKMSGFYQDLEREHQTVYTINNGEILNEDCQI